MLVVILSYDFNCWCSHKCFLFTMQMVHLGIEFMSWCSMVVMLFVETKIYVKEFRWYIRFGLMYVLVGDAVIFNFIFPLRDFYAK